MVYFNDLIGNEYKLYLAKENPDSAFFRLNNMWIVISDGHYDTNEPIGELMNAKHQYIDKYIDTVEWVGPFKCIIESKGFIATESYECDDYCFNVGDVIAYVNNDYDCIKSEIYDDYNFTDLL